MGSSVDDVAQRVLSEHSFELDIGELLGPDDGRGPSSESETEAQLIQLEGHTKEVTCAIALPDGRLATGSKDKTIRLWQPTVPVGAHNSKLASQHLLRGHKSGLCALACVSLKDACTNKPVVQLVSGSHDSNVRLWDLSTRQAVRSVTLADSAVWNTSELVSEPSRNVLLLALRESRVRFYSLADGKMVPLEVHEPNDEAFSVVRVIPSAETAGTGGHGKGGDSKENRTFKYTLATGSYAGHLCVWRVRVHLKKSGAFECGCELVTKLRCNKATEGHTIAILALAVLSDKRLASANAAGTVRLWNVDIGECTETLYCGRAVLDVCALRGTSSRPTTIAALVKVNEDLNESDTYSGLKVHLLDVGNEANIIAVSQLNKSSHHFLLPNFVCFGSGRTLYSVLLDYSHPETKLSAGRIHLWPISHPRSERTHSESSPLGFEDLKQVLLALQTKARGNPVHLEVLNLSAVRLRDEDVDELLLHLRTLPHLKRVVLSRVHCEPIPPSDSLRRVGEMSSSPHNNQKLSARGLVRLFLGLQYVCMSQFGGAQSKLVSLAVDGDPVIWRQAYEAFEKELKPRVELHTELVEASHASLVQQFANALYTSNVETQQLEHMFASVLCVDDLRWTYTLLNALRYDPTLSGSDREALNAAFRTALKWVANHVIFNEKSVAALKSVLRSANERGILKIEEFDEISELATKCDVFNDQRITAFVEKVNAIHADLSALEQRMSLGFAKMDARVATVEMRVERAESIVKALAENLQQLRAALAAKHKREATFVLIKVQIEKNRLAAFFVMGEA